MSAISDKYASLGGASGPLGAPVTAELVCPDGVGHYQHYTNNASIYWTPNTGAHAVVGLIRGKWSKLGWERSPLGYPTSDETESPTQRGRYSLFQHGAILWKQGAPEAFESHGAIRAHWNAFKDENGFLGFPLTDQTPAPDPLGDPLGPGEVGQYNNFEGGSIYWKATIGAHEVHGLIRDYWTAAGGPFSPLGYPISDESPGTNGNRYSDFENGVVFWKNGASAADNLLPFPPASQQAATVESALTTKVSSLILGANSSIYVQNGPSIGSITDYSYSGNTVQNRNYVVQVTIGYKATLLGWDAGMPDPHTDLTINIQLYLDKPNHRVVAYLTSYTYDTSVPFPTSIGVSAGDIDAKLKSYLDPMIWKPQQVASVPSGLNFLSGKTMANGDFNMYIEPLA